VNPVNVGSIGEYIRQQREQAKISLRQLASAAGVSNPYLSQIERGLRRPSAEILQQIAKGLRISAEALYVQAGILEDRRPDSGVRAAVLADPELTERQKQVLLEIYESFRRELVGSVTVGAGPDGAEPGGLVLDGPVFHGPALDGPVAGGAVAGGAAAEGAAPEGAQPAIPGQAGPGDGPVAPGAAGTAAGAEEAAQGGPPEPGPVQTGTRG
jgi:transcriptional regulator with XRE-family HTH domain